MDIHSLTIKQGADSYYDKDFMDILESHMEYFRTSDTSNVTQIDTRRAVVYEGDFYGYLNEVGIEPNYHWLIMRVNGMYSTTDFNSEMLTMIVPNRDEVNQIKISHKTTGVIKI